MRRTPFTIVLVTCVAMSASCISAAPSEDASTQLEDRGMSWLDMPATVTYRTLERDAGEATSTHQCLRQYADAETEVDRQDAIRICSSEGTLLFTQEPPRWRMDLSTPDASFTLISTPDGTFRCGLGADEPPPCSPFGGSTIPFDPILRDPNDVLASSEPRVTDVSHSEERRIAGVAADCFSATGRNLGDGDLEWCYSASGLLLSFTSITGLGSFTSLEATEIRSSVSPTAFDLPPTIVDGTVAAPASKRSSAPELRSDLRGSISVRRCRRPGPVW